MSRYIPLQNFFKGNLPVEQSITDRNDVLEIRLDQGQKRKEVVILFDDFLAYRKRDEGDALYTLGQIAATGELGHLLYQVEDSEFLDWFVRESEFVREKLPLKHICVTTSSSIVDVICFELPKVK